MQPARRRLPVWLLVAVALILCLALVWQVRVAGELESQVATLQGELSQVSEQLDAHRNHLVEIRGGVHDLSASFESLRMLVDRDPAEIDPSSAAATDDAPGVANDPDPQAYPPALADEYTTP